MKPDASMLRACADVLAQGKKPSHFFSQWSSGGYKPYSSKEGREEHDEIVSKLYEMMKK